MTSVWWRVGGSEMCVDVVSRHKDVWWRTGPGSGPGPGLCVWSSCGPAVCFLMLLFNRNNMTTMWTAFLISARSNK